MEVIYYCYILYLTKTISKLVTHGANRTHASSFLNREQSSPKIVYVYLNVYTQTGKTSAFGRDRTLKLSYGFPISKI